MHAIDRLTGETKMGEPHRIDTGSSTAGRNWLPSIERVTKPRHHKPR